MVLEQAAMLDRRPKRGNPAARSFTVSSFLSRVASIAAPLLVAACTARSPSASGPPRCPAEGGAVWREVRSEHFRLVTDLEAARAVSELYRFEQAYDAMVQTQFPRGAAGLTRLVVFRTDDELHAFVPHGVAGKFVDDWAMEDDETGTALFGAGLRERSRAVFHHELAHRLLSAGFADVPPWFSEGLAVYFESMRVEADGVILGDWSRPNIPARIYPPVRELIALDRDAFYLGIQTRDVGVNAERQAAIQYMASWHLVHLLLNGPNVIRDKFRRVIRTTNAGGRFEPAFRAFVDEVGASALEQAFRVHAEDGDRLSSVFAYTPSHVGRRPETRELSPAETHLLWAKLLWNGPEPRRALREIDEALRHAPHGAEARLLRAYVQLALGDVEAATAAFEAMTTEAPTNGAALAGLLCALLETPSTAVAPPAHERIGELAARLASVATTAHEHMMAVESLARTGNSKDALAASSVAVRAHPTSYRLQAARGVLLAHAGRYREAAASVGRALEILPERTARGPEGRALAKRLTEYRSAAERESAAP